jgi:hypothetical protein
MHDQLYPLIEPCDRETLERTLEISIFNSRLDVLETTKKSLNSAAINDFVLVVENDYLWCVGL